MASKKMSYEMEEPAFLRRMRAAAAGQGCQERYIAPRNRKVATDDDEDAPAYVMEDGQELSREEFKKLERGQEESEEGPREEGTEGKPEGSGVQVDTVAAKKSNVTEVGPARKKRKAAKIVGADEAEKEEPVGTRNDPEDNPRKGKVPGGKKAKRKIKLSFGEDE